MYLNRRRALHINFHECDVNLMNTVGYLQSTNNPPVGRVPALEDLQMAHPKWFCTCVTKFWVKIILQ